MNNCRNFDTCDNSHRHCTMSCENFIDIGDDNMSDWYCSLCEEIFDEEDLDTINEDRGYYGSEHVFEKETVCPYCSNGVEETVKCIKCCEWFGEDQLTNGVCSTCFEEILDDDVLIAEYVMDEPDILVEFWKEHGGLDG